MEGGAAALRIADPYRGDTRAASITRICTDMMLEFCVNIDVTRVDVAFPFDRRTWVGWSRDGEAHRARPPTVRECIASHYDGVRACTMEKMIRSARMYNMYIPNLHQMTWRSECRKRGLSQGVERSALRSFPVLIISCIRFTDV